MPRSTQFEPRGGDHQKLDNSVYARKQTLEGGESRPDAVVSERQGKFRASGSLLAQPFKQRPPGTPTGTRAYGSSKLGTSK